MANWNISFRKQGKFAHPNPNVANGLKPKPALFEYFPQAAADAYNFVLDKLEVFSVEMLREHIIDTLIPGLLAEAKRDGVPEDSLEYQLLRKYKENAPSPSTIYIYQWVGYLGFRRDHKKKSYYVNGHEHLAQKKHGSWFTNEYLTVIEPYSHRWVQITKVRSCLT